MSSAVFREERFARPPGCCDVLCALRFISIVYYAWTLTQVALFLPPFFHQIFVEELRWPDLAWAGEKPREQGQVRQSPFHPGIWGILTLTPGIRTLVPGLSFQREGEEWAQRRPEGPSPGGRGAVWKKGCSAPCTQGSSVTVRTVLLFSVAGLGVEGPQRFPGKV